MFPWDARIQLLSNSAHLSTEIIGREPANGIDYPLYSLTIGSRSLPPFVVTAGVHGDEPETVEAALRFCEDAAEGRFSLHRHRLVVLPCINPSGLNAGTRVNSAGQDINRQFHADLTPVTAAVRRYLTALGMDVLVDLHADRSAAGFYCFELLQEKQPSLAPAVQQGITEAGYRLEEAPFYAGCVGKHGLIAPNPAQIADFERMAPGASLAHWAWQIGVSCSYVFETPQSAGPEAGVGMHLTALRALFHAADIGAKAD